MAKEKNKFCECCGSGAFDNPADALMAVCVLAMASDGKLSRAELDRIYQMTVMSPVFKGIKDSRAYAACIAGTAAEKGRAAVMAEASAVLSPRLAETAYAWAAQMIAADGKTVSPEHKYLSELRKALGLHGVLAGKINAVVGILNRAK